MDASAYIQAIFSLIFVIALIGLISLLLRKFTEKQFIGPGSKQKRLSIEEMKAIDPKRRLIIVKRDNVEHLVMLGTNSDLLIESNIKKDEASK